MADQQEGSDAVQSVNGGTDQVLGARSIDVVEAANATCNKEGEEEIVVEIGSATNDVERKEVSKEPSESTGGFEDSSFNIEVLRSQLKRKDAQIKDLKNTIDERDITKARQNVELGRQQFSESGGLRERKVHEDKEELRATIGKLEDDIGSLVDGKIVLENQLKNKKYWQYGLGGLVIILLSLLVISFMIPMGCPTHPVCPHINITIYKEKIDQLSKELKELGTINDQLKNKSEKVTADLKDCKTETGEISEKVKNLETDKIGLEGNLSTEKQLKAELEGEKTRLEAEKKELQDELTKLDTKLTQLNTVLQGERNQLEIEKQTLKDDLTKLDTKLKTLDQESHQKIDKLQTDLSECRTVNDKGRVTESDLEPIKLGEQFRTIYEQHYTMAIDELEVQHGSLYVKKTVQMFLDILKTAHKMTEDYTKRHIESMNKSITSLEIDKSEEGKNPVFVNSTLSMFDLKNFYEIRQKCAWRMLDSVAKELGDVIARQFNVNPDSQPKMMTYIRNCVSLCWKTNMLREPVYINFTEPGTREKFDYDTFKPFLYPTGDYMDYVVWPPMYLHKGGKMIAKGIAEKKD